MKKSFDLYLSYHEDYIFNIVDNLKVVHDFIKKVYIVYIHSYTEVSNFVFHNWNVNFQVIMKSNILHVIRVVLDSKDIFVVLFDVVFCYDIHLL